MLTKVCTFDEEVGLELNLNQHPATPTMTEDRGGMREMRDFACDQSIELILTISPTAEQGFSAELSSSDMNISACKSWEDSVKGSRDGTGESPMPNHNDDTPAVVFTSRSLEEIRECNNSSTLVDHVLEENNNGTQTSPSHFKQLYDNMIDDIRRSPAYSVCKDILVAPSLVPVIHQQNSFHRDFCDGSASIHQISVLDDETFHPRSWAEDDEHRMEQSPLRDSYSDISSYRTMALPKRLAFPVRMRESLHTPDGQKVVIMRSPDRKMLKPRPFMVELLRSDSDLSFE